MPDAPVVHTAKVHDLTGSRSRIVCICGHELFDGIVIRSRVLRLLPRGGAEAKCRCKQWIAVPVTYSAEQYKILD